MVCAMCSFISCSDDDDFLPGGFYDDDCIFITVKDAQGALVNDSTQLAEITGFQSPYYKGMDLYRDPFSYQFILNESGQWVYCVTLNEMRFNTEPQPGINNFILRDTLTLGTAQYALEERLHYDITSKGGSSRTDYHLIWLKVNGKEVTSERPKEQGMWITLQAK